MLRAILAGGLVGGFAAGLLAAVLHLLLVQPVLLEAERYEAGELVHIPAVDAAPAEAEPGTPSPAGGPDLRRDGTTVLAFGLTYAGWGLLLAAGLGWATRRGVTPSARAGLAWGAAAWVAAQLAPALGLPPGLPGMAAADLVARQAWWAATAAATAGGLLLLAFGRGWGAWAAGLVLVAAPHVLGAPEPPAFSGPAPPELAALFAARALGVGLAAWLATGLLVAALLRGAAARLAEGP